jgi:hypothetical protein
MTTSVMGEKAFHGVRPKLPFMRKKVKAAKAPACLSRAARARSAANIEPQRRRGAELLPFGIETGANEPGRAIIVVPLAPG